MNSESIRKIAFDDIRKHMSENRQEYKFSESWEKFEVWNVTINHLDSKESTDLNKILGINNINHNSERKIKHLNKLWKKQRKKTT